MHYFECVYILLSYSQRPCDAKQPCEQEQRQKNKNALDRVEQKRNNERHEIVQGLRE